MLNMLTYFFVNTQFFFVVKIFVVKIAVPSRDGGNKLFAE